jgi:beta-1,2-mannobiose phosphorylase / 1,2-beta-oligomannan phosphorylase
LLVLYEASDTKRGRTTISIGSLLLSRTDPEVVLWRSDEALQTITVREKDDARTLGAVVYEHEIVVYLSSDKQKLFTIQLPNPYAERSRSRRATRLHRFPHNPVMSPSAFEWESHAVFNPAALVDNGKVHLLYRAMGPDGVSRIGYAASADGIHFDERLPYPVYTPSQGYGEATPSRGAGRVQAYDASNPSGGGWAGCEDPRVVSIDGHVYMTFVAFDGWDFMRQAMTAIKLDDLNQKNWNWRDPVLISKPGQTHKNWVIFPEKIGGKYAILHGLSPTIHIDYVDSLDAFDGDTFIDSLPPAFGGGYHDPRRKEHWDTRVRGAGAPPIRTDMGWLLLYHATDRLDPGKYKLGAMILDLEDPTKVLYRTNAPILEPEEWYENDGKPGVVYTCGAVVVNENLIVYYGGGDKHIAIARANVAEFLKGITTSHPVPLKRV